MYTASEKRYNNMKYERCGKSGILLPRVALGMWHNFGSVDRYETMKEVIFASFDSGITHFDLANNYGPAPCRPNPAFFRFAKQFYHSLTLQQWLSS